MSVKLLVILEAHCCQPPAHRSYGSFLQLFAIRVALVSWLYFLQVGAKVDLWKTGHKELAPNGQPVHVAASICLHALIVVFSLLLHGGNSQDLIPQ